VAIRWGILSTADINRKLLAGAAESEDVEVVAVGSRDLDRAQEFAQRWEIPRAYGTYDELLADPEVEAIYNPLPNTMHTEWSIRALEAGKHVLCEKPFSRRVEDVVRAFAASEATGRVLSEAFMYRYHPQTAQLVELVRSGTIGELRVIRSAFSYSLYDTANIRLRTDVEGGALMDVGCYCVSGARLLAGGEPESVSGVAYTGPSGTDWVFTGMLRFPGDVVALFDCGTSLPDRDELEAVGTQGSIFLDDPWHCDDPVIEVRRTVVGEDGEDAIEVEEIEVEAADPYRLELEAMNAAIRGDAGAALGREDAIGQVRTIDALFRAAAGGETVAL
jgi:D-xylose 1-dehydrogenase (NADP+, D-xylono-1,5-lactone-forming)